MQCYVPAGSDASLPDVVVTLGYASDTNGGVKYTQLCSTSLNLSHTAPSAADATGYITVTASLFQNAFQKCIPMLAQINSFRFQPAFPPSTASPISFCLDDISLLNSSVQLGEQHSVNVLAISKAWCPIYSDTLNKLFEGPDTCTYNSPLQCVSSNLCISGLPQCICMSDVTQ